MFHDNRGMLCSLHLATNIFHDNRGRLSAHRTLLPTCTMITEAGPLLTTPCYLTCTMIEAGSLITTLTCTMITVVGSLLTTPCFLTCTMITEACSLLTTPCYLICTMITKAGSLLTTLTPCCLTCTMITEVGFLLTTPCYLTYQACVKVYLHVRDYLVSSGVPQTAVYISL